MRAPEEEPLEFQKRGMPPGKMQEPIKKAVGGASKRGRDDGAEEEEKSARSRSSSKGRMRLDPQRLKKKAAAATKE